MWARSPTHTVLPRPPGRLVGRDQACHAVAEHWASDTGIPAMLALAARSHALLAANPAEAEGWFRDALRLHGHRGLEFERARTQLLGVVSVIPDLPCTDG